MYNINKEQELKSHQSHLIQNIRNVTEQSYNQSFIESYGGQLYPEPLQQLDTHHLSHHLSHSHQVRIMHRPTRGKLPAGFFSTENRKLLEMTLNYG